MTLADGVSYLVLIGLFAAVVAVFGYLRRDE